MLSQLEAALEGAPSDPAMKVCSIFTLGLISRHHKGVFLAGHVKIHFTEPCDRHRNAIATFAYLFNVVRRITFGIVTALKRGVSQVL